LNCTLQTQVTSLPPEPPPDTGPAPMPAAPALPSPPPRAVAYSPVPSNPAPSKQAPSAQLGVSVQSAADGAATQPVLLREGAVVLEAAGGSLEAFCRQALRPSDLHDASSVTGLMMLGLAVKKTAQSTRISMLWRTAMKNQ